MAWVIRDLIDRFRLHDGANPMGEAPAYPVGEAGEEGCTVVAWVNASVVAHLTGLCPECRGEHAEMDGDEVEVVWRIPQRELVGVGSDSAMMGVMEVLTGDGDEAPPPPRTLVVVESEDPEVILEKPPETSRKRRRKEPQPKRGPKPTPESKRLQTAQFGLSVGELFRDVGE